jgi:hypothetical protein
MITWKENLTLMERATVYFVSEVYKKRGWPGASQGESSLSSKLFQLSLLMRPTCDF